MAAGSKEDEKCRVRHDSIDRISMVPDDILGRILCLLSLKEATASSILSRRWRNSWTFTTKLDFKCEESVIRIMMVGHDLPKALEAQRKLRLDKQKEALDDERLKFMRWVNHIIASRNDSSIEDFKVHFNLDKTHGTCIDEWLRYALSRKVQTLELNLTIDAGFGSRKYDDCYTFPYNLLRTDSLDSVHFKQLRRICMSYVNVSGEAIEFFLQNCPRLEDLSVSESGHLLALKITGPFPSFKRLEILWCNGIESVEICDVDLVYFKYKGKTIHFVVVNVGQLVNMHIGGRVTNRMEDVVSMFSSLLPQLEIFTFDVNVGLSWAETEMFYSAVKMKNLKQLRIRNSVMRDESLLPITNLLRASPCLQSFVVKAPRGHPIFMKRMVKKISASYPQLKEVKFLSYHGMISDLELIVHIVENAKGLEEIIVDPRITWDWDPTFSSDLKYKDDFIKKESYARTRAKDQLSQIQLSPGMNLKILD